jgi:hypothetical protein
MDIGPVLALEPLSTILPSNYRHLQHPQALDRPTLFLGADCSWETPSGRVSEKPLKWHTSIIQIPKNLTSILCAGFLNSSQYKCKVEMAHSVIKHSK